MTARPWRDRILTGACIMLLVLAVLALNFPWSPVFKPVVESDSGLYAYMGSAIVQGQIPYRDAWEQKPPIGFYLNALAVLLFGQTPWAIWRFNLIWLTITTVAFFLVIRRMMGWVAALAAGTILVLGFMQPEIYQGGNLMESYGILPQVLIIAATFGFFAKRRNHWALLSGLLTGLAFMTKQTTIALGIGSSVAILGTTLLRREYGQLWRRALVFGAGFVIPVGLATLYWFILGALEEFLAATILFGFSYVGEGAPFLWSVKHTTLSVFPGMFISKVYWLAALAILPYMADFGQLIRHFPPGPKRSEALPPVEATLLAVFVALPVELVFASLGGRNFGHYFMSMVPAIATILGYAVWRLVVALRSLPGSGMSPRWAFVACWFLLVGGALIWSIGALRVEFPTRAQWADLPAVFRGSYLLDKLGKFVVENTGPDDRVLVWHIHVGLNFVTGRRPPQRILFPAMLFIPPDQAGDNLDEFISEFEQNPPKLILVQQHSSIGLPFVDVPVEEMCPGGACIPQLAAAIQRPEVYDDLLFLREYFLQHYEKDVQINDWLIYSLVR